MIVSIGQNIKMSYENSIWKEVKQMNLSPSNLKTIEHQFDAFCKTVLRNEARNIYKHNKFIANMETCFSSITYKEEKSLFVEDEYQIFCEQLNVMNFVVNIKHELLFDALSTLKPKKRDVVLLRYWLNMTDEEIAQKLNLVRRTVNYMRTSSLNEMKKFMEDTVK